MAWRAKKIFSLIPPVESEDSDIDSDDDLEGKLNRRECFHKDTCDSSSPRTISPALYDILADLSGSEDTNFNGQNCDDHEHLIAPEQLLQMARDESSSLPGRSSAPVSCYIPETPSPIVAE